MALVLMMRHGQAENNVKHILAGRDLQFHLTEAGRKQVASTANSLKSVPIDAIYTSPVVRTQETAAIVSETIGVDYVVDERLTETEMGSVVGMGYSEVLEKYGNLFLGFYRDGSLAATLGIEKFSDIRRRVDRMLEFVANRHRNGNVLLVTHLDPIKAAITRMLHLTAEALFNMSIRNASLTILGHGSDYHLIVFNVMDINRYHADL